MPNIERRKNTWYATLHVPSDVRLKLGTSKLFKSLQTTDKRIAEQRASVIVAKWKADIQAARGNADPFISEALDWRGDLLRSENQEVLDSVLLEHVEEKIAPRYGHEAAKSFYNIAAGNHRPLVSIIPEWKAEVSRSLQPKTVAGMVKDVGRMVAKFPTVQDIDRKTVRAWLEGLATGPEQLSSSSITRIVGFCRNFWRYLQEIEEASKDMDTPFVVPSFAKISKKSKAAVTSGWVPFKPAEVMSLHVAALVKDDQQLADLIMLGAFTGARIEEICSIKVADVGEGRFNITDSKTSAGIREVPIHSALVPLIDRLKQDSKDGYLLSGLTFNKYGDRSNAVGKRFGRLKDAQGFGAKQVFHSIRKTVVTLLENAGVSENLTADIVGHDKPRITYGLYSGGASIEVMREAIERIQYPVT